MVLESRAGGRAPGGGLSSRWCPIAPEPAVGHFDPVGRSKVRPRGAALRWHRVDPCGNSDPNLAACCGALARSGCCRARAAVNGRRSQHWPAHAEREGADECPAYTHGRRVARKREQPLDVRTPAGRMRLFATPYRHLPAEMAAKLARGSAEVVPPEVPAEVTVPTDVRQTPSNCLPLTGRGSGAGGVGRAAGLSLHGLAVQQLAVPTGCTPGPKQLSRADRSWVRCWWGCRCTAPGG